jgi:hypothetical protein
VHTARRPPTPAPSCHHATGITACVVTTRRDHGDGEPSPMLLVADTLAATAWLKPRCLHVYRVPSATDRCCTRTRDESSSRRRYTV